MRRHRRPSTLFALNTEPSYKISSDGSNKQKEMTSRHLFGLDPGCIETTKYVQDKFEKLQVESTPHNETNSYKFPTM